MLLGLLLLLWLWLPSQVMAAMTHVVKEHMIARPSTLVKHGPVDPQQEHEVTIAIAQANMDVLEARLQEMGNPTSPTFQQWMSADEVAALVDNPEGYEAVKAWLEANNVRVDWAASSRHYIRCIATVERWEQVLHTEFHTWKDTHPNSAAHANHRSSAAAAAPLESLIVRSEHYSVPVELEGHILGAFGVSQSPPIMTRPAVRRLSPALRRAQPQAQPQAQAQDAATRGRSEAHTRATYAAAAAASAADASGKAATAATANVEPAVEAEAAAEAEAEAEAEAAESARRRLLNAQGWVDPPFLASLYQIGSLKGDANLTQAVFETEVPLSPPYYSSLDLEAFLTSFSYPYHPPINYPSSPSLDTKYCNIGPKPQPKCDEGNLDLQYIQALSQATRTVYWTEGESDNPFVSWAQKMQTANPLGITVVSISFGATETTVSDSQLTAFNNAVISLGATGVTIVVAAGDNGAPGIGMTGECSPQMCNEASGRIYSSIGFNGFPSGSGYFPSFPATSPYVTSVGATMGPELGLAEEVCSSDRFYTTSQQNFYASAVSGVITSGGGFSAFYDRPWWQQAAVTKYLSSVQGTSALPQAGFNTQGRAYPDVSFVGARYSVQVQGSLASIYGTSASAPVFAAMVSLVNALRKKKNKRPIGWINPTLYLIGSHNQTFFKALNISSLNSSAIFNDITAGNNKCCSAPETTDPTNPSPQQPAACCQSGFTAVRGWDPASGWGSIDFTKFAAIFSVAAPYIPPPVPPAPAAPDASAQITLYEVVLVLLLASMVVGGIWYAVKAARRMRAGALPPPQQQQQQQQQQQVFSQHYPQPFAPRADATMAIPGPASGHGGRLGGGGAMYGYPPDPHPQFAHGANAGTYAVPAYSSWDQQQMQFQQQQQLQQQQQRQLYPGQPSWQDVIPGTAQHQHATFSVQQGDGGDNERCPRCGRGFVDAVALVDHVGSCSGR